MSKGWYKRDPAAALNGMARLSLEVVGAYNILLDTIYLYGSPIPDDDRHVSGLLRVSVRKWRSIRRELLDSGKLVTVGDALTNSRAEVELENRTNLSRARANAGRKGGEASTKTRKNKGLAEANASSKSKQIREDKSRGDSVAKATGAATAPAVPSTSQFIYAKGKELLGKANAPPKDAGALVTRWLRRHGEDAVLSAFRACEAKRTPEPVPFIQRVLENNQRSPPQADAAARRARQDDVFDHIDEKLGAEIERSTNSGRNGAREVLQLGRAEGVGNIPKPDSSSA